MITCTTISGETVMRPKSELAVRVAAYGVVIDGDKILVQELRNNDKYFFPGGGLELGETRKEGLRREMMEEVGMEIEVVKLLHSTESFFYYEPEDATWQFYGFFYLCKPVTKTVLTAEEVDDCEALGSRWVKISDLKNSDFKVSC